MNGTRVLALVIGFWVLMRAINKDQTGRTLIDHLIGNKASQSPLLNAPLVGTAGNSPSGTPLWGSPNKAGFVNPVPGATGSRLDQGFDVTGKTFLAPFTGKVLVANQSDPGWKGGGYLAIQNATNPKQVIYMAEGIAPTVRPGDTVQAGQTVGLPAWNAYNGVVGNIETGPASPTSPGQPLAQVVSNPAGVVNSFYNWLRGLGGPVASSTAGAGHP